MKCGACKFDSDGAREEDGFVRLYKDERIGGLIGRFPQHEAPDVDDEVLLWMCPKCGTVRGDSWRLKDC